MNPHDNSIIVNIYEKLLDQIKNDKTQDNTYRIQQTKNIIGILRKYPKKITSGEQLQNIKGIGKNTIARINEILNSGTLKELSDIHMENIYFENLQNVFGIGNVKAYELIHNYGIKTVDELKKAYETGKIDLPHQIVVGLKYYGLYERRIQREEIDKIFTYLKNVAIKIDPKLIVEICGSYRRGNPVSNDIDVLIVHPDIVTKTDQTSKNNYLIKFVTLLKHNEFIIDDLTDKDPETKYMGFCQYTEGSKTFDIHRIDIRYLPYESHAAALLYFTGSGEFNRKMRSLAKSLGYILNEYGLYKIKGKQKIYIQTKTEEDIFKKLGLEYVSPTKRNIY